eukprot:Pgem_evm1s692
MSNNYQSLGEDDRLNRTQAQVDEVVDVMRNNVNQVLERDERLTDIEDRSSALE